MEPRNFHADISINWIIEDVNRHHATVTVESLVYAPTEADAWERALCRARELCPLLDECEVYVHVQGEGIQLKLQHFVGYAGNLYPQLFSADAVSEAEAPL